MQPDGPRAWAHHLSQPYPFLILTTYNAQALDQGLFESATFRERGLPARVGAKAHHDPRGRMPALPGRRRPELTSCAIGFGSGRSRSDRFAITRRRVLRNLSARRLSFVSDRPLRRRTRAVVAVRPSMSEHAPTSCVRSGSPARHAPGAWLPDRESAGIDHAPVAVRHRAAFSPARRIAPRPPGSDRSVSVRPIDRVRYVRRNIDISRRGTPDHGRAAPIHRARDPVRRRRMHRGLGFPAGSRPGRPRPGRCPASGGVLPCPSDRSSAPRKRSIRFCPSNRRSRCVHRAKHRHLDQNIGSNGICTGIIERYGSNGTDTSEMRNPDPGRVLRAGVADRARDALAAREPVEPVARAPRDRQRPHPIGDRLDPVALEPPAVRPRVAGARAGVPGPGVLRALVLPQWLCGFARADTGSVCMARDRRGANPAGNHGVVGQCS